MFLFIPVIKLLSKGPLINAEDHGFSEQPHNFPSCLLKDDILVAEYVWWFKTFGHPVRLTNDDIKLL